MNKLVYLRKLIEIVLNLVYIFTMHIENKIMLLHIDNKKHKIKF